ncbi:DNA mismatch repair endonuclease MutL [Agarivorans albus]|uniref:DNA mismatch repair protein MutL n=1 Tax=Agarivorans albus MKT 106 TaxID=1331007 RepID=R9PRS8_AGAAL|nr:DNA mismatch repair endonuclease MutL [Agarivorans albus]GAD03983.1 DNA mismatch repair protein MutL [Agarivorans albus MKT 106]
MPIQILPAQLANQIAAGEVVERPASVVKELIENCLDAGATRIDIEIDKGGAKRILIRDNGSGIAKEQLGLALSRHATSKIDSLDDLSAIATLGFRGEALASISSVSRLSLSSRTAEQEKAWQAQAAGRDMQVSLQPCAHPIGSSVDVLDLFFNTPARRKFLRTEKTEFSHIDELLKRLALSRFDVALSLKHNGKLIRQYRIATDLGKQLKRVSTVFGAPFANHCLHLDNQHDQLRLHGWLGLPEVARAQNDQQYFYVNGRMMRDKLLQHAIRQAFAAYLPDEQYASYVLFLELPLDQVDVNVHPAKHEVRFHQARLVHDYIVQVLASALSKIPAHNHTGELLVYQDEPVNEIFAPPLAQVAHSYTSAAPATPRVSEGRQSYQSSLQRADKPRSSELSANHQWLSSAADFTREATRADSTSQVSSVSAKPQAAALYPLHLVESAYLLARIGEKLILLDLWACQQHLAYSQAMQQWPQGLDSVPLLLPLKLALDEPMHLLLSQQQEALRRIGFVFNIANKQQVIVAQVPKLIRKADFAQLIPSLLTAMSQLPDSEWQQAEALLSGLIKLQSKPKEHTWQQAIELSQQLHSHNPSQLPKHLWRAVDLSASIESFNHDN